MQGVGVGGTVRVALAQVLWNCIISLVLVTCISESRPCNGMAGSSIVLEQIDRSVILSTFVSFISGCIMFLSDFVLV